jgi:hypothetical protein
MSNWEVMLSQAHIIEVMSNWEVMLSQAHIIEVMSNWEVMLSQAQDAVNFTPPPWHILYFTSAIIFSPALHLL